MLYPSQGEVQDALPESGGGTGCFTRVRGRYRMLYPSQGEVQDALPESEGGTGCFTRVRGNYKMLYPSQGDTGCTDKGYQN